MHSILLSILSSRYAVGALIFGAQDNSVFISQYDGSEANSGVWSFQMPGDGTTVCMDDSSSPTTFYGCSQSLGEWASIQVGIGDAGLTAFNWQISPQPTFQFQTPQAFNRGTKQILVCTDAQSSVACYSVQYPDQAAQLEFDFQQGNGAPQEVRKKERERGRGREGQRERKRE